MNSGLVLARASSIQQEFHFPGFNFIVSSNDSFHTLYQRCHVVKPKATSSEAGFRTEMVKKSIVN